MSTPRQSKRGRPARAVLYARGLNRARAKGVHVPAATQLARLRARAAERGYEVLGEFVDTPDTGDAELLRALATLLGGGVLLAYDADRLGGAIEAVLWKGAASEHKTRVEFFSPDPPLDADADHLVTRLQSITALVFRARKVERRSRSKG